VAYLLLTHKDRDQVEALAARVLELSPAGQVVVHHDRRDGDRPWPGGPPDRVHLVTRGPVAWGGWSIVEATLRLVRFARDRLGADWFVLISGEHWPVRDLAAWEAGLDDTGADAFMPAERLPGRLRFGRRDLDANRFLARCTHRWVTVRRPRWAPAQRALSALSKATLSTHPVLKLEFSLRSDAWFVGLPRRRGPVAGWTLYKGTQWVAFNRRAADAVVDVDPAVTAWFSRSHIPDESYLQTVVRRAGLVVADTPVTWVPPEPVRATPGWMLLRQEHLERVAASGAAFARKVDPARNPEVIAAIDASLGRPAPATGTLGSATGAAATAVGHGRRPEREPVFAYLLLTHKEPAQVAELAARLLELSPSAHVVVHHDRAATAEPWDGHPPARVHLVDRSPVLWGDWSIVEATLRMVRHAVEVLDADWFVTVSGEHRPVVDLGPWERRTASGDADALVVADALPSGLRFGRADEDANRFLARCVHRWTTLPQPRPAAAQRALGGLWKMSRYVQPLVAMEYAHRRQAWFVGRPRARRPLLGVTFYKGSQWMAFNRRAAEALLGTPAEVTDWFRVGHIPDETYIATVLHNRDELVVGDAVVTYVPEGPERPGPVRWMVLDLDDLPAVWRSGAAFARKVDPVERPEVIKTIDDEVDRRRGQARVGAEAVR
jgi:hypothetical protein